MREFSGLRGEDQPLRKWGADSIQGQQAQQAQQQRAPEAGGVSAGRGPRRIGAEATEARGSFGSRSGPGHSLEAVRGAGVWRQGLRQSGRRVVLASQPSAEQMRVARPRGAVRAGRVHRGRGRAASHRSAGGRGDSRVRQGAGQVGAKVTRRQVCWIVEAAATGKGHGGSGAAAANGSGGLGGGPNDGVQGFGSQAG